MSNSEGHTHGRGRDRRARGRGRGKGGVKVQPRRDLGASSPAPPGPHERHGRRQNSKSTVFLIFKLSWPCALPVLLALHSPYRSKAAAVPRQPRMA